MPAQSELDRAKQRAQAAKQQLSRASRKAMEEFRTLQSKIKTKLPDLRTANLLDSHLSKEEVQEALRQRREQEERLKEELESTQLEEPSESLPDTSD